VSWRHGSGSVNRKSIGDEKSLERERRVKVEGRSSNIIDLEIKRKSRNGISFLWLLPWRRDV
jgi:hypothetical protein